MASAQAVLLQQGNISLSIPRMNETSAAEDVVDQHQPKEMQPVSISQHTAAQLSHAACTEASAVRDASKEAIVV